MMQRTNINWCDYTWNPIVGCTPCSPGCDNCYAAELHGRRHRAWLAGKPMPLQYSQPFHSVNLFPDLLRDPLRTRKPATIFVCSMGDLFHETIPLHWVDTVFAAIALTPRHRFLILTKRPKRMVKYVESFDYDRVWRRIGDLIGNEAFHKTGSVLPHRGAEESDWWENDDVAAPPNLWLGVTVCNQAEADEKIPILLETPAAHRFVSIEPMLGPVDLSAFMSGPYVGLPGDVVHDSWNAGIDLVIVGGETGKKARAMHPDWVRSVRDQCAAARVPFHFKGWGEWCAFPQIDDRNYSHISDWPNSRYIAKLRGPDVAHASDPCPVYRLGSRRSGRLLDAREHNGAQEAQP